MLWHINRGILTSNCANLFFRVTITMQVATLGLVVVVCLTAVAAEAVNEKMPEHGVESSDITAKHSPVDEKGEKFFLGGVSTATYTDVVMVTSTVFFSCLSGTSAAVCDGRRRKRSLRSFVKLEEDESSSPLASSQDEDLIGEDLSQAEEENKSSKDEERILGFNIWTTSRITSTVTMLYTDTNTTIRLSYFCQAGQQQLPTFNCVGAK
ncbi:uncharacterized protein LOC121857012 [Homarus americanus]|uniref:uncharacterized protein LOC121857012 n=1 Tax=Homarus americanus TaxID=6706 RepID=UPI001C4628C1|nr:uncharacterized protein LOC121857012 [Homarus americanus]